MSPCLSSHDRRVFPWYLAHSYRTIRTTFLLYHFAVPAHACHHFIIIPVFFFSYYDVHISSDCQHITLVPVPICLIHLAISRRIPLSLARPPVRLEYRYAQSLVWCLNNSFNDWSPLHQGFCCTSLLQYNYSFSMILVISSRVNDGFSFCQLHFSLSYPVCCANTHDIYDSTGDSFRYLRNVATFVQCTYIPVSDLHDVFGVYQWPTQLGGLWLPCIIESLLL